MYVCICMYIYIYIYIYTYMHTYFVAHRATCTDAEIGLRKKEPQRLD